MTDPGKIFEKYLKICALAEQGEGGEAVNARKIRDRMLREHTWLEESRKIHLQQEASQQGNYDSSYGGDMEYSTPWNDLFTAAQSVYSKVSDFAETVSQARHGAILAAACRSTARISKSGNLIVGVSIPEHIHEALEDCNNTQLRVFRNEILESIERELNQALELTD